MLRVGDSYGHLAFKAKQGSASARAALDAIVAPQSAFLWRAFTDLSQGRQVGATGAQPIAISEIAAWCEFNRVGSENMRRRVFSAVRAMDREFLNWTAKHGAS